MDVKLKYLTKVLQKFVKVTLTPLEFTDSLDFNGISLNQTPLLGRTI